MNQKIVCISLVTLILYLFDNLAMASFPSTTEVIKDLENSTASALYSHYI